MSSRQKASWESSVFLLHRRPLKEGKILVDLFSERDGRVTGVMRYAKARRRGKHNLAPFQRYWCRAHQGQSELLSIVSLELEGPPCWLMAEPLMCGLYLNELLLKLCHPFDSFPKLFQAYQQIVSQLATSNGNIELHLREFDFKLLQEIGYGIPFDQALASPQQHYQYHFELGFVAAIASSQNSFSCEHLAAMAAREWQVPGALAAAKRLCRQAIKGALGEKTIKSRMFFQQPTLDYDTELVAK